jgi:protein-S-isoprenylcysteine O-methyltransferase Ste14
VTRFAKSWASMRSRLLAFGTRLYGDPPAKGATRVQRLRYVRKVCLRGMWFYVPVLAFALAFDSTFLLIVIAAMALLGAVNALTIQVRIRHEERRAP